ncbi:hypothetical protein [Glycomyces salinus]|uniref:hypothetical protein n=1 Tax=Glycomyces salinus TaxID=980294 RepID=UPI0018EAA9BD|nr:hypothetical protein [Glycomyces salinus]
MLDVFVCTSETADATGVLVLDGRPVAAGDGRYQIELPPGGHRVEVQGADAASSEFDLAPGERVCFTAGHSVAVRHQSEYRTRLYRVRDGSDYMPVLSASESNRSGVGCLMAVAGTVVLALSATLAAVLPEGVVAEVAAVVAAAGALALIAGVTIGIVSTRRFHRRAKSARLEPVHRSVGNGAFAFPSPEDLRTWRQTGTALGVAVVFDLFFYRLSRGSDGVAAYAGSNRELALAHAGRPRLWIDGVEVPSDWSTWYYSLAAGEHRFRAEYGPDPLDGSTVRHEFAFEVKNTDDIAVLQVPVRVFRIWDDTEQRLTGPAPQIAHRVSKRARNLAARSDGRNPGDFWHPPRSWPRKGESHV